MMIIDRGFNDIEFITITDTGLYTNKNPSSGGTDYLV